MQFQLSAVTNIETLSNSDMKTNTTAVEFARCFLRLANLPNFALDRLSRYEATLWRQAGRILHALEILDRRKSSRAKAKSNRDNLRFLGSQCQLRRATLTSALTFQNGSHVCGRRA